ncbi:MAG: tyrosine-type recombinase/integrase [Candidatus Odinarchaeota archaeon]
MTYSKEWFSKIEIHQLFHNPEITSRDLLLMKVCYYGALRISEALNSKREDYRNDDYTYLILRSQKTDKKNWEKQPIPPELFGDLNRYCTDNKIRTQDYIFQSNRSPRLSYPMAYKLIKKCVVLAGVNKEITTHSFRRSRATHLLDDGLPLNKVSGFLRHKSIETTLKYLKISKKQLFEEVNEIDKKTIFNMLK